MSATGDEPLDALQARLGYQFQERKHLLTALTHSSALGPAQPRAYERLEFLGDAVVGLVLSDLLLSHYPEHNEGQLSKFRAALVNTGSLASKARELGLDAELTLGKGEEKTGGRAKASILAAVYEAVIGAMFLESGYERTRQVVGGHFGSAIAAVSAQASGDAKTELQELCQQTRRRAPVYRVVEETGPDHARRFVVDVMLGDATLARGEGSSKRGAEQDAARQALRRAQLGADGPEPTTG